MLRKRCRTTQNEQSKSSSPADAALDSSHSDAPSMGSKSASFFRVPALFVGLSGKLQSECDSASSPTSPLEWKGFCNPINPLGSPKPTSNASPRCWDCNRVGLSIVDSLNDELNPVVQKLNFSENQNVPLGSSPLRNSTESPGMSPLETNGGRSGTFVLQRSRSFSSDCMQFPLPLTRLVYCNPKSNSDHFCSGMKEMTQLSSAQSVKVVPSFGKFAGLPSSLPVAINSSHRLVSSLSPREVELYEDYTCVITHGPNPKATHIFGDCILESDAIEVGNDNKEDWLIGSPPRPVSPDHPRDFLSFCCSCNKKLEQGNDIYMYRFVQIPLLVGSFLFLIICETLMFSMSTS